MITGTCMPAYRAVRSLSADDGDLIAVLGILHIDKHKYRERQNDDPADVNAEQCGKTRGRFEHRDFRKTAARRAFPGAVAKIFDNTQNDIIQHQCKKRFVGSPFCLKRRGDRTPQTSRDRGSHKHGDQQNRAGKILNLKKRKIGRRDGAGKNLSFRTDIPKLHFKSRSDRNRSAEKRYSDLCRGDAGRLGGKRSQHHIPINGKRIVPENQDQHTAGQQCECDGENPDQPRPGRGISRCAWQAGSRAPVFRSLLFPLSHACHQKADLFLCRGFSVKNAADASAAENQYAVA